MEGLWYRKGRFDKRRERSGIKEERGLATQVRSWSVNMMSQRAGEVSSFLWGRRI